MSETADAIIIGAGIVGAACADALCREGMRVVVVESGVVGGGATGAGMGHIVVMDDSEAQFALTRYSRDLWTELFPSMPAEAEVLACGTLWVAADDEEMDAVRARADLHASRGVRAEVLDSAALAAAEPNLRAGLAGGLLVPDDSVIYAPCAAQWLMERSGAALRAGTAEPESGGVVLNDGSRITAGMTICATGTSATTFFPWVGVRPRKGHLAITDRYPGFLHHQVLELGYLKSAHGASNESVAFNVQPRATGQLLIGSSRQYGTTDSSVEMPLLGRMLRRACEYMPALGSLSVIRAWTGFRAATGDKLPVIGPCPDTPNLYLATGHEGLGITTSLGTARLLCDCIFGRSPKIDPRPYLPARLCPAKYGSR